MEYRHVQEPDSQMRRILQLLLQRVLGGRKPGTAARRMVKLRGADRLKLRGKTVEWLVSLSPQPKARSITQTV